MLIILEIILLILGIILYKQLGVFSNFKQKFVTKIKQLNSVFNSNNAFNSLYYAAHGCF